MRGLQNRTLPVPPVILLALIVALAPAGEPVTAAEGPAPVLWAARARPRPKPRAVNGEPAVTPAQEEEEPGAPAPAVDPSPDDLLDLPLDFDVPIAPPEATPAPIAAPPMTARVPAAVSPSVPALPSDLVVPALPPTTVPTPAEPAPVQDDKLAPLLQRPTKRPAPAKPAPVRMGPRVAPAALGEPTPPIRRKTLAYVATGVSAAAGIGGALFGYDAMSAAEGRDTTGNLIDFRSLQDRAEFSARLANVSFALAAASLGVGIWLYFSGDAP